VCHVSAVSRGRSPSKCFPQLGPQLYVITGEAETSLCATLNIEGGVVDDWVVHIDVLNPRSTFNRVSGSLKHTVASSKTRMSLDLSTHAKESMSLLESLQKASEWAQSHVIVSYDKCGSLGDVGITVRHAVCDYVRMLVYSSQVKSS